MNFQFESVLIEWRGPAPFVFAPVPGTLSNEIKAMAQKLSYGWGVIPVTATIGQTRFKTSLFPKNGIYLLPVKLIVQKSESVDVGDNITATVVLLPKAQG